MRCPPTQLLARAIVPSLREDNNVGVSLQGSERARCCECVPADYEDGLLHRPEREEKGGTSYGGRERLHEGHGPEGEMAVGDGGWVQVAERMAMVLSRSSRRRCARMSNPLQSRSASLYEAPILQRDGLSHASEVTAGGPMLVHLGPPSQLQCSWSITRL